MDPKQYEPTSTNTEQNLDDLPESIQPQSTELEPTNQLGTSAVDTESTTEAATPPEPTPALNTAVGPSPSETATPTVAEQNMPPQTDNVEESTPYVVAGGDANGPVVSAAPEPTPKPKSKKKLWLIIAIATLFLLLSGGYVFGYYLPNRPEAVWSSSLERTGKGLQSIVKTASEEDRLKSYKAFSLSGNVNVEAGNEGTYSGDFTAKFDDKNLDSALNVKLEGEGTQTAKLSAKLLAKTPKDSIYPALYLQVAGFKDLDLDGFLPGISAYDGKWILLDSAMVEDIAGTLNNPFLSTDAKSEAVTPEEATAFAKAISDVTTEYVLTSDANKAVLEQKSFEGKETVNGVKTYHYTAAINKEHATDYCLALSDAVISSAAYKKMISASDARITSLKERAVKECPNDVTELIKNIGPIDVWMDSQYKLVHKIRITDKSNKGNYAEFGQTYKGSNKLSVFINTNDTESKTELKSSVDIDLDADSIKGAVSSHSSGDEALKIDVKFEGKGLSEAITVTAPTGATPFKDVMQQLTGQSTL